MTDKELAAIRECVRAMRPLHWVGVESMLDEIDRLRAELAETRLLRGQELHEEQEVE
jgi:hypothetical protein